MCARGRIVYMFVHFIDVQFVDVVVVVVRLGELITFKKKRTIHTRDQEK